MLNELPVGQECELDIDWQFVGNAATDYKTIKIAKLVAMPLYVAMAHRYEPIRRFRRLEGDDKEATRRRQGDHKEAIRRLSGGYKKAIRTLQGDYEEAMRRL